ncbi:MAG: hypothetical protein ACRECA_10720 [Pseudolabrys sp.]
MQLIAFPEWTSAISAVSAAIAAIFSAITVFAHKRAANEQRAADAVKKYIEIALQHPSISGLKKEDKYDWFVSFMLLMVRDVLAAHKGDKSWEIFVRNQIGFFRDDLRLWKKDDEKNKTNYLKQYGADVERIVDEAIATKDGR